MGFTQTCLRAPSAILQQETNLAATSSNREAQLWAVPLCRVKKSITKTSDCSFGGCAQNCGNLAFSRRRHTGVKLDNLQAQFASSSYFSSWSLESLKSSPAFSLSNNLVSPNSKRQTASCNSGSRSISSPSPGSPRYDSEEGTEFQEKAKRGSDVFQDFQGKFQEQDGDEESHLGYNNLARSASAVSDLFNEEGKNGNGDEGAEDGDNSAGYESWGDESDTSTQSSGSASVGSVADSLAIGGKEPVYQVLK